MTLHIDLESRGLLDLTKTGVYAYAEHILTEIWCAAYAFDDGPVHLWEGNHHHETIHEPWKRPPNPCPQEVVDYVMFSDDPIVAHNANFERAMWHHILTKRWGWPEPATERWRCTMAQAYAMALPGSLENAAAAVGLDNSKDRSGRRLMLQMAKPRNIAKDGVCTWWGTPDRLERLFEYCKQDVEVERELDGRLLTLRPSEQQIWVIDQEINDRGVFVDSELCEKAKKVVKSVKDDLDTEMFTITDAEVSKCSNRNQIISFLKRRATDYITHEKAPWFNELVDGAGKVSIAKDKVTEAVARDDLPDDVRRCFEIKAQANKTSVSKIDALMRGRSFDGRARGLVQYHAASTGRWGGRRFQPQNIKRPDKDTNIAQAIDALMTGNVDLIKMLFDDPLSIIGDVLRSMIKAAPGKKLVAGDWSNIEGRVLAWLAGEEWKLQAFREFDAGIGPDLYKLAYHRTFGTPLANVDDDQRQIGKVEELALGFGGGHGAFITMGAGYGVKPAEIVPIVRGQVDEDHWGAVRELYDPKNGLPISEWTALRIVIDGWRAAHAKTKQYWYDLEDAVIQAVESPGSVVTVGQVKYRVAGSFLWCRLPSGRSLCYPYPEIRNVRTPWGKMKPQLTFKSTINESNRGRIINDPTNDRFWARISTYGGSLAENNTQATARDVLAETLVRLEAHGYENVLHVHDEPISEVNADFGSAEEFKRLMEVKPDWLGDCPVAAATWEGERYRK